MCVADQLMREKTTVFGAITEAAQRGESLEVLAASERLQKIQSLIDRYEKLKLEISDLAAPKSQRLDDTQEGSRLVINKDFRKLNATSRDICNAIRMDFLKKLSEGGHQLRHIRGTIYETKSGRKVGIPVATERKPDRWFLGLPVDSFDHAILLCKRDTGDTVEIFLAKDFFDEYGARMSQSAGEMKFNVVRRGNVYAILVPGTDGVSDSKFQRDYSILK